MTKPNKPPFSLTTKNPPQLYSPRQFGYSHICEVKHFNTVVHISGQGGENAEGHYSTNYSEQLDQVFKNLKIALSYAHIDFYNIAVLSVLIVNFDQQKHHLLNLKMNTIWKDQNFPACTLIPVSRLALDAMQIEIEATAYCSSSTEPFIHV